MSFNIYLRQIVHGDSKPIHIELDKQAFTLGGNEYPELNRYSKVSHPHAYIVYENGQWYVKDLNSLHGTYVNRCRVGTRPYPIQIGDQIGLGATESYEDGFICALCVKTLVTQLKEPLKINISDKSPCVKIEPNDDYIMENMKTNISAKTEPIDDFQVGQSYKGFPKTEQSFSPYHSKSHLQNETAFLKEDSSNNSFPASRTFLDPKSENVKRQNFQTLKKNLPTPLTLLSPRKSFYNAHDCKQTLTKTKGLNPSAQDPRIDLFHKNWQSGLASSPIPLLMNSSPLETYKIGQKRPLTYDQRNLSGVTKKRNVNMVERQNSISGNPLDSECYDVRNRHLDFKSSYDNLEYRDSTCSSEVLNFHKNMIPLYNAKDLDDIKKYNTTTTTSYTEKFNFSSIANQPEISFKDYFLQNLTGNKSKDNDRYGNDSYPGQTTKNSKEGSLSNCNTLEDMHTSSELTLQMDKIPEQNKICTSFLASKAPIDHNLDSNKLFNDSQNYKTGKDKFLTSPFIKEDAAWRITENPKLLDNSSSKHSLSKDSSYTNMLPVTKSSRDILNTIPASVLKNILTSVNLSALPSDSSVSGTSAVVWQKNIPLLSENSFVDDTKIQENKLFKTDTSNFIEFPHPLNSSQDSQRHINWKSSSSIKDYEDDDLYSSELTSETASSAVHKNILQTTSPSSISELLFPKSRIPKHSILEPDDSTPFVPIKESLEANIWNLIDNNMSNVEKTSKDKDCLKNRDAASLKFQKKTNPRQLYDHKFSLRDSDHKHKIKSREKTLLFNQDTTAPSKLLQELGSDSNFSHESEEFLSSNSNLSTQRNISEETDIIGSTDVRENSKWLDNWVPLTSTEKSTSINRFSSDDGNAEIDPKSGLKATPESPPGSPYSGQCTFNPKFKELSTWLDNQIELCEDTENVTSSNLTIGENQSKVPSKQPTKSSFQSIPSTSKQFQDDDSDSLPIYEDLLENEDLPSQVNKISPKTVTAEKLNFHSTAGNGIYKNMMTLSKVILQSDDLIQTSVYYENTRFLILKNIVEFDLKCLKEKKDNVKPPSTLQKNLAYLPLHFSSFDHYVTLCQPLLVLEVWQNVYNNLKPIWKEGNCDFNVFYFTIFHVVKKSSVYEYECETIVNQSSFAPVEGNLLLMKIKAKNDTYYNGCYYVSRHSVVQQSSDMLKKNSKKWRFTVFGKKLESPPIFNKLMKGNGIGSLEKYFSIISGLENLKASPLCQNILEANPNIFCEYSKSTLKLSHSEAVCVISKQMQKAPSESKIMLLQGAPGTGKTQAIVNLVRRLVNDNPKIRILVTCATDTSLDEIGNRLLKTNLKKSLVRHGDPNRINKEMMSYSLDNKADQRFKKTLRAKEKKLKLLEVTPDKYIKRFKRQPEEIPALQAKTKILKHKLKENLISESWQQNWLKTCKIQAAMQPNIVLSTIRDCISLETFIPKSARAYQSTLWFSCCIVDDASSCTELELLQCLIADTNKLVLIGDPQQVLGKGCSSLAASYGYERSLFSRFSNYFSRQHWKKLVIELNEQFRMNDNLWHFPSKQFLKDHSMPGHKTVWKHSKHFHNKYFVFDILGSPFDKICDDLIAQICSYLRVIKKTAATIGIITPSRELRSHYMEHVLKNYPSAYNHIEIDTVDAFIGREKDIIILSCDQTKLEDIPSFLSCRKRFAVALTRACHCLIVCMGSNTLQHIPDWQDLVDDANERKVYRALHSFQSIHLILRETVMLVYKLGAKTSES